MAIIFFKHNPFLSCLLLKFLKVSCLKKGEYVGSVCRFLKKLLSLKVTKFGISELKVIFLEDLTNNFKKSNNN